MTLLINGKPIYLKGANWIPDDCFPHRVTPERYALRVDQALAANMNMLRVWGGGMYEDDAFYDICDERGVMVWQDFAFACATYPEEPVYAALVEQEARDNVKRLAHHASLVIWNGNNETVQGTFDWSPAFKAIREEGVRGWGLGYFTGLLPAVLQELDPSRPYCPTSPYSGSMDRPPNANEFGNTHIWDVWLGAGQYRNYLGHYPRLATEFGYHAPPAYATIARAIPTQHRQWDAPMMMLHNKNGRPGQQQTNTRMADDFVPPTHDYDAWHYLAQVMQARALTMGIEWFRALNPWNQGALFWQFNDCWPVSSWSCIDGDGRTKPLYYACQRFFKPRLLTIKPQRVSPSDKPIGKLRLYAHNDTDHPWATNVLLTQRDLHGNTLRSLNTRIEAPPRCVARCDVPDAMHDRPDAFLVAAARPEAHQDDADDSPAFWWFSPDKTHAYPEPRFHATLKTTDDGQTALTLHAQTLLRDVCLYPDRLDPDATIDRQCITLLPGDHATFHIQTRHPLTLEQLTRRPVLQCVNYYSGPSPAHA